MEANRKRTQVHMLPTEDITNIVVFNDDLYLNNGYIEEDDQYLLGDATSNSHQEPKSAFEFQHLYFTTDEEIKEGDWAYSPVSKEVKQVVKILPHKRGSMLCYQGEDVILSNEEKIIATTDPKLRNDIPTLNTMGERTVYPQLLPRLSQDFIEEYCKAGGIDKVLVEYECLTSTNTIVLDFSKVTADEAIKSDGKCIESRLKVDSNNCIIIHPVEERGFSGKHISNKRGGVLFTESDLTNPVEEKRKECMHDFHSVYYGTEWEVECKKCEENIFDLYEREDAAKWIKENL